MIRTTHDKLEFYMDGDPAFLSIATRRWTLNLIILRPSDWRLGHESQWHETSCQKGNAFDLGPLLSFCWWSKEK